MSILQLQLQQFKSLIGARVKDTSQDAPLQFILSDVEEIILNYCNIEEIPNGLKNTAYRMAMDIYRSENIGQANDAIKGEVSSISEGDASVSFKSTSENKLKADNILKNYQAQLSKYRKLVW